MKLSTRQDIAAPIDFVFQRATDFDAHGRQVMRRGIEIERADNLVQPGPGMCWNLAFTYRGKPRKMFGELVKLESPESFQIESQTLGIEALFTAEFMALSRGRTRLIAGLQLTPKALSARLLIQSLKLAKSKLDQGFSQRVAHFARDTQDRYAQR
jgi:hypothetical protein